MPLEAFYGTLEFPLTRSEVIFAKRICQACPVIIDCALTAFRDKESYGMWAGATPSERREISRQHSGDVVKSARYLVGRVLKVGTDK